MIRKSDEQLRIEARALRAKSENAWRRDTEGTYNVNASTDEVAAWAASGGAASPTTGKLTIAEAGRALRATASLGPNHPDRKKALADYDEVMSRGDSIDSDERADASGVPEQVRKQCPAGMKAVPNRTYGGFAFIPRDDARTEYRADGSSAREYREDARK